MLNAENAVLVIVDIQGKLSTLMYDKEKFFENCVRMIRSAKVLDIPIIWNEQLPDKLGDTIDIIKNELSGMTSLAKSTFSCCGNSEFLKLLKSHKRQQVLLIGMESHVCVYQTAVDLIKDGYEVYLVTDAVSSRTSENRQCGFDAIKENGGKLTSVEMALFEMLQKAEGDHFKQIIKIIK